MMQRLFGMTSVQYTNRRKLLDLLRDRERTVQDLASNLEITVGGVSQHLQILHACGLVTRRKAGRHRYYRSSAEPLKEVYEWVGRYQRFWAGRLDELGNYLDEQS